MTSLIENNFLEDFRNELSNFSYKYVYVSIGSKYNQDYVQIEGISKGTNAKVQILPKFLKKNEQLIIMIDRISSEESKLEHINYINERVNENSKCIIINTYANANFIEGFLDILLPKLFDHYIDPNNFVIATFLKFLNTPNKIEMNSASVIQKGIYNYLKLFQDKIYINCFYEWFGYKKILYNYIYNYHLLKTYQISSNHFYEIETIINRLSNGTSAMVLQNQDIINILDIMISLTIKKKEEDNYLESIYKHLLNNKRLVYI
tara:strand:+ start:12627 stop:13412 length:786 start_codon:yes stop_codon:yes gene_type:complete